MYKIIKSRLINQKIFIHLYDAKLLKLIKYNKTLQKKLDISLFNYKMFTGKYIVYDIKGNGKEYNYKDELVFEGEYLNGTRNRKGKEYYNGKLEYEGEYLNGKRNGKGKEYYDNGNLQFDGEYSNGKRQGKGKEYYDKDKLKFEGEFLNDKKHGKGKEYYDNGKLKFEGEFLYGRKWTGKGYNESTDIIYELKD